MIYSNTEDFSYYKHLIKLYINRDILDEDIIYKDSTSATEPESGRVLYSYLLFKIESEYYVVILDSNSTTVSKADETIRKQLFPDYVV